MTTALAATSAAEPVSAAASATAQADAAIATAPNDLLAGGTPRRAKSIGHTSYVLKVTLDNGAVGAFKPRSGKPLGDRRYKGEIAAYRLAEALGLNNVPRTIARTFRAVDLRNALPSEGQAEFDRVARTGPEGDLEGALTAWVDAYEVLPLESAAWRSRWMQWLTVRHPEIAASDRAVARAISTLIAFDCMTANWDRWSGANVARDASTGTVLYVDNDGAFFDDPPPTAIDRQFLLLGRVVRFSRAFISALRSVDIEVLRSVLGKDERGAPLLPERNIFAADARRRRVLEIVDAAIAREGADDALAFE
jgi:hypothetical protein